MRRKWNTASIKSLFERFERWQGPLSGFLTQEKLASSQFYKLKSRHRQMINSSTRDSETSHLFFPLSVQPKVETLSKEQVEVTFVNGNRLSLPLSVIACDEKLIVLERLLRLGE